MKRIIITLIISLVVVLFLIFQLASQVSNMEQRNIEIESDINRSKNVSNPDQTNSLDVEKELNQTIMMKMKNPPQNKERLNVLFLGIEGKQRSDAIILISFNPETKKLDLISIPRDTYYYEEGHSRGDQRKINAKYGRNGEKGSLDAVTKILKEMPIHHFISIEYQGVEEIVDLIGGVEIDVPLQMEVGGIIIPKGKQVLTGKQALQFLRFRKKYVDGDLGRIKAQQSLIESAINKLSYSNIISVVKQSYKSIKTDMKIHELIVYALYLKNIREENINAYILPGVARYKVVDGYNWSYYFIDKQRVQELINKIYDNYK